MDAWPKPPPEIVAAGVPLTSASAWVGGFGALGVGLLLGCVLLPRHGARRWHETWLLRCVCGLYGAALLVLGSGQVTGLIFRAPWTWLGLAGWIGLLASGAFQLRRLARRNGPTTKIDDGDAVAGELHASASGLARAERIGAIAGWLIILAWMMSLLMVAFAPPINYDVLEYHLGVLPHFFREGRVTPLPHVFYSAQPCGTELLYALAALIEGTPWGAAPGVLQWLMFGLGILLIERSLNVLRIRPAWRPWLVLLILGHPIVFHCQVDRLTDWTGAILIAAGIWVFADAFYRQARNQPIATTALLGFLAGAAAGTKWTHLGTVSAPLLLCVPALHWRRSAAQAPDAASGQRVGLIPRCAIAAAVAAAAQLPWSLWLWAQRRNPFAPFLAHVFPSETWGAAQLDFLLETHGRLRPWSIEYWSNLCRRLFVELDGPPIVGLALIVSGLTFIAWVVAMRRRSVDRVAESSGTSAALRGLDPVIVLGAGLVVGVLLWGQLRHAADRFLCAPSVLSVFILAIALRQACALRAPTARLLVTGALALGALAGLHGPWLTVQAIGFADYAMGRESRGDYLKRTLGLTADLFEAANRLPREARILTINEARPYYFTRHVDSSSVFDRNPLRAALTGAARASDVIERLKQAGYTHLLVNEFEQARLLVIHSPLGLLRDEGFKQVLAMPDEYQRLRRLAEEFRGWAEFAVDPLSPEERAVYLDLLAHLKPRAAWTTGDASPAMWIAPLD